MTDQAMLAVALAQAKQGLTEGGIPIGAALFDASGNLLGSGRNRRVQQNDPSVHGETDAFRNAGRVGYYGDVTLATTLAPCWYCSGLIRQFGISRVIVGENENFAGGIDWLREAGVEIVNLHDADCTHLLRNFIEKNPILWQEDIGTAANATTNGCVRLIDHPLAQAALTVLRDRHTDAKKFRQSSLHLGTLLLVEALRDLGRSPVPIETPLAPSIGWQLAKPVCFVPILRAGLALLDPARELLPDAPVGFLGMERDEETAIARSYYQKMPADLANFEVVLLDPMLATGGSMIDALDALRKLGAAAVTVVCVVAAPEGIKRLQEAHPGTKLVAAAIDDRLDENAYIVPGLGDYGDRYFGT